MDPRARAFVIFIFFLFLINSPPPQQGYDVHSLYDEVIEQEWAELDILNTTRYGDFDATKNKWLNISGLREEEGYAWELLGPVQQRATERTKHILGDAADAFLEGSTEDPKSIPVYRNISGYVQGEWFRSPLGRVRHPSDLNTSTLFENPSPESQYDRNLTGTGGMVRLHLTESEGRKWRNENGTISQITARIIIGDDDSVGDNWWEFNLNGVHFPKFGGAVLTTTSDRFAGIFALPHFQLSQHLYSESQELLNRTIHETIDRQLDRVYPLWNPWSSAIEGNEGIFVQPHCEFVLFLQEHPIQLQPVSKKPLANEALFIEQLEQELRFPTGAPVPRRSPLTMSMVGFSPDCGFVIESKGPPDYSHEYAHLVGAKTEEFNNRARHGILVFAATLFLQVNLILKQMKETATPSTRNRVSFYTIAMLAIGDGFAFLSLLFLHLFLETSQLVLYAAAFISCFSMMFGLRYLFDIWTVQSTERERQNREQASTATPPSAAQPPNAAPTTTTTTQATPRPPLPPPPRANAPGLPLPVTTPRPPPPPPPRPQTPIIIAPDQDDPDEDLETILATTTPAGTQANTTTTTPARPDPGTLYTRYTFCLLALFFTTLHFTTTRATVRSYYFNTLCFFYLSFWIPQIYRNVLRNCRKALRWDFVLGQSVVRLVPITYFYALHDNFLFSENDTRALMVLVAWVWMQIVVLACQEVLGSRFFVKEGWAPPAYDYHPILREDEEGGTMPIGLSTSNTSSSSHAATEEGETSLSSPGESKGKGRKVFDCSICAMDIEVPVIASGAGTGEGDAGVQGLGALVLQRRAYMVTPCRHIFHTACLEGWMRYRLQCPNCREVLPPL